MRVYADGRMTGTASPEGEQGCRVISWKEICPDFGFNIFCWYNNIYEKVDLSTDFNDPDHMRLQYSCRQTGG